MSLVKITVALCSVLLSIYIIYITVQMLNTINASNSAEMIVKVFIIFSVIYTSSKTFPLAIQKILFWGGRIASALVKNNAGQKPFN